MFGGNVLITQWFPAGAAYIEYYIAMAFSIHVPKVHQPYLLCTGWQIGAGTVTKCNIELGTGKLTAK